MVAWLRRRRQLGDRQPGLLKEERTGSSTDDPSLAEYVTADNPCPGPASMLCRDDMEGENESIGKEDRMQSLCKEFCRIPVSMKNDRTAVCGERVTGKKGMKQGKA